MATAIIKKIGAGQSSKKEKDEFAHLKALFDKSTIKKSLKGGFFGI